MIEWFLRYIHGFLAVTVTGKNTARFLNLCVRHNIFVWNLSMESETKACFFMKLCDIYALHPFLRKTRTRLFITKRRGLPFLLHKYRKRKPFFLFVAVIFLLVCFLSTRIWRIEIKGNASLGEDTIMEYLKHQGITYGISASAIDHDELELSLRKDFAPVIWASVYEEGTKLVVCIQEKIEVKQTTTETRTCMDRVAAKDATIASIITRSGTPKVKKGDKVKKGGLLVCGRQEILDDNGEVGTYYYKSADADIYGITFYDYSDDIPMKMICKKATGEVTKRYFIRILDYRFITPSLKKEYAAAETVENSSQFCILDSFYLPVYWGEITTREMENETVSVSKSEAKKLALTHFQQFLADLEENGVRIMDKNVMMEQRENSYHIYGRVKACENIAETAPTEVKQMKRKEPVNESE